MKYYIAPEAKLNCFQTSDVVASSWVVGGYDENKNSYNFWDLDSGIGGEQNGSNDDPVQGDW